MTSRDVIRRLEQVGWRLVRHKGIAPPLRSPSQERYRDGTTPSEGYPVGTLESMERQAGIELD